MANISERDTQQLSILSEVQDAALAKSHRLAYSPIYKSMQVDDLNEATFIKRKQIAGK